MIFVVDNGEVYSDHMIYFVETAATKEQVEAIAKLRSEDMKVVAEADTFVWFEGGSISLWHLPAVIGYAAGKRGSVLIFVKPDFVARLDLLEVLAAEADRTSTWSQSPHGATYTEEQAALIREAVLAVITSGGQVNPRREWPETPVPPVKPGGTIVRRVR